MTTQAFFDKVRSLLYRGALAQSQVDGINAVIRNWQALGDGDDTKLAYILATVYNETGGSFEPVEENLNYTSVARLRAVWPSRFKSDASAAPYVRKPQALAEKVYGHRDDLGNDQDGDGFLYRGRGLGQTTGKNMYRVIGHELGVDLVAHPEALLDLDTSAAALIVGMQKGLYTGRKLSDYVDADGNRKDYRGARTTVNGDVRLNGAHIAEVANDFEVALAEKLDPIGAPEVQEPTPVPDQPVDEPTKVPEPAPDVVRVWDWKRIAIGVVLLVVALLWLYFTFTR